jgi:hypothetical protein
MNNTEDYKWYVSSIQDFNVGKILVPESMQILNENNINPLAV